MLEKEVNVRIYCSEIFFKIIQDYQKRFYEKHKVKPSIIDVTKIISTKIEKIGGLIV